MTRPLDKTAEYEARTKAFWAAERAKLEADVRAHIRDVSGWWKAIYADCDGHPLFPNFTALMNARRERKAA